MAVNKGIGRPLVIALRADTSGLAKGLGDAEKQLRGMQKSVAGLSKKATIGLAGVAAAGYTFANAAMEDEKSARVLATTLKKVTGATTAQVAAVEDYISKTSLALGITDDKLRPAFSRLVRSTEDAAGAQQLLNLALDISAATGKDLDLVANSLGKAYDGNGTALGRMGLGIDSATLKSKDFSKIYESLTSKFGGFAKSEAATTEGSFRRISVAVDEAKESVGYGLLPYVQSLAGFLTGFAPKLQANADLILKLGTAFTILAGTVVAYNWTLKASVAISKITTGVYAGLRLVTLTLAAATGSASAAQRIAELTYKGSTAAQIAYKIAMMATTTQTLISTAATKYARLATIFFTAATGSATSTQLLARLATMGSTTALVAYRVALITGAAATRIASTAVWSFTAALLANPITWVILAVAGLTAATYLMIKAIKGQTAAQKEAGASYREGIANLNHTRDAATGAAVALHQVANATQEARDAARAKGRSTYVKQLTPEQEMAQYLAQLKKDQAAAAKAAKAGTAATTGTSKAADKLAKAQAAATVVADRWTSALDAQREKLKAAKDAWTNYRNEIRDAITSQISFQTAFEKKGKGSFIDSLTQQVDAVRNFGSKIGTLLSMGLSQDAIAQVTGAGAEVGTQIADEIIAGGTGAIARVNTLVSSVKSLATIVGNQGATIFYQKGIDQAQAMMDGLTAGLKKAGLSLNKSGQVVVPATLAGANNVILNSTKVTPESAAKSVTMNITVNGAVDPHSTARQIQTLIQNANQRAGYRSLTGAAL